MAIDSEGRVDIPIFGRVLLAVALAALVWIIASIGFPLIPWTTLAGGKAPIEVFALFVGPLGALAAILGLYLNGRTTNRALQLTVQTERSTRFQKAVDMVSSGKNSAIAGGMALLDTLAHEEPSTYMSPVCIVLAETLSELDLDFKRTCSLFSLSSKEPFRDEFPPATAASSNIVGWFGHLRPPQTDVWPSPVTGNLLRGRMPLYGGYLDDTIFTRSNFSTTDFERMLFKDVHFIGCGIRSADWSGSVAGKLAFRGCDLRGTRLKVWGVDNQHLEDRSLIVVANCKTDGFTINAVPCDAWYRGGSATPEDFQAFFERDHPVTEFHSPTLTRSLRSTSSPSGGT